MARFKALKANRNISDEALDAVGTVELSNTWMTDHMEAAGEPEGIRSFDEEGRAWSRGGGNAS